MDDELLSYFEGELSSLREMGSEFARKYPKVAGRLLLEPDKCEDPHTERLIEAFAFLCARVHQKLDDGVPQITQSLLNVLYPHCSNPIPSLSVVKFRPLLQNVPASGYPIGKGTVLVSKAVDGVACQFTTAYPVTLWPMEVASASLSEPGRVVKNAQQALRLRLKLHNMTFSGFPGDSLRFFLSGQRQQVFHLYELLLNNVCHIECESVGAGSKTLTPLAAGSIRPVGFDADQSLLPFPVQSFPGYRLLLEYFAFAEKFHFLEIAGLSALAKKGYGDTLDLCIYLDQPARTSMPVTADAFCLYATPAVNAFTRTAEPIRVEHRKTEYRVIPDLRRLQAMEVLSVDSVSATVHGSPPKIKEYQPLYSISHHHNEDGSIEPGYWHLQRRSSGRFADHGTDVFLSFCDSNAHPVDLPEEIITVRITCSNRDIPAKLPFGAPGGDFETEAAVPVEAIISMIRPTPTLRPALGGALQWRLISHLSLNYLSLVEGGEEALKEILTLCDFEGSPATRQQISGITSLHSRQVTRRIGSAMCRGVEVTIEFDEDKYVGSCLYLFASVLERFLGEYVSLNSFVQLVAKSVQRKEIVKRWPPRNGERVLL